MKYAELIVDSVEPDNENTMYLSPSKLNCSQFFSPNVFDKATIKNCSIEQITSGGLVGVFTSLKPLSKVYITVFQPIAVMVFYDTKQIEANLKLVGFENIKISDINIKDEESGQKIQTKLVEAQKPKGVKNIEVDVEVTKQTYKEKNPYKKKESILDKYMNSGTNKLYNKNNEPVNENKYYSKKEEITTTTTTTEVKGTKPSYYSKRFNFRFHKQ